MKNVLYLILLLPFLSHAQPLRKGALAAGDSLLKLQDYAGASAAYRTLLQRVKEDDTLLPHLVWNYTGALSGLERAARMKEDFAASLQYGTAALDLLKKYKHMFDAEFAAREAWMVKNVIVSYFGLGQFDKAVPYRAELYKGYKDKTLPKGIDGYFNFDFFTLDRKNIWGYEWYPELGDPGTEGSFTKIVYYVYSRNADGTDKDQLYRLHVLKFHKIDASAPDYILTKTYDTEDSEISGSYYRHLYNRPLDYSKIREDVKVIVHAETVPDTKRIVPRRR
jgi:hypothetical protein